MVSWNSGPSPDKVYFGPRVMSSCIRPFFQVVLAGGMEVVSLQVKVTLVPSGAVTSGSPWGNGGPAAVEKKPDWLNAKYYVHLKKIVFVIVFLYPM